MKYNSEWCKKTARALGIPFKMLPNGTYELISKRGGIMRGSLQEVGQYLFLEDLKGKR